MKPIVKGNWASSSTRIRMNNMNIHYEEKGCFAIGLATQFFELQRPFATHYISTPMSVIEQVA